MAETGSLKEASKKLKVNQTTVGRNISALESEVGVLLFERRSDGFVLSSAGRLVEPDQSELIVRRMGQLKLGLYGHSKLFSKTGAAIQSAAWSSVFSALKGGLGIGILPTLIGDTEKSLQPVLKELEVPIPIWLVYHPDLKSSARIRAFIDYVDALMKVDF